MEVSDLDPFHTDLLPQAIPGVLIGAAAETVESAGFCFVLLQLRPHLSRPESYPSDLCSLKPASPKTETGAGLRRRRDYSITATLKAQC